MRCIPVHVTCPTFDTWPFVVMEVSKREMANCSHEGKHLSIVFRYTLVFKYCSIDIKGPYVGQKNIPHTITTLPPACTVNTMLNLWAFSLMPNTDSCKNLDQQQEATGCVRAVDVFPPLSRPVLVIACPWVTPSADGNRGTHRGSQLLWPMLDKPVTCGLRRRSVHH